MTDCNYRFSNRIMTLVLLCLRKSSTTLYRWSGSVLNYEVVVVLTATAGGQSGPIVFPCVLIIRVKKTTNSGDPDGCVLHELLPSNLFILAGESSQRERLAYDIITSSMSVLGGLACWTCLHDFMSFRLKQTQSNETKKYKWPLTDTN